MSNVPKSRRNEHDFQATHKLHDLRKRITELAIYDFGYDKVRREKQIQRFEQQLQIPNKEEVIARMREKNESFYSDFVQEETQITRQILREIVCEFELGNSIFPSGEAKEMEFLERRKHLDLAIGKLFCLKQEIQYIAETLPCDKNRYESISDDIKELVSLFKGVRRSGNRFLK